MAAIAERGRALVDVRRGHASAAGIEQRCARLLAQRGEASSIALAADIVDELREMDAAGTDAFLQILARRFAAEPAAIESAVARWRAERDEPALIALVEAVEPPRQDLFRRLNAAPGGTRALVDLRARLLDALVHDPGLVGVEADLRHLLGDWFNRGFLQVEEISWSTPAKILELLIRYEAVHEIRGWEDLRRRLAGDRRCFAFFHPALPDEPLIFVEVALTRGLATAIAPLIDPERAVGDVASADTAIFYSISNCQIGLRGISFGNFLIKQVVAELAMKEPRIRHYATLSPIPGLARAVARRDLADGFTSERLRALLQPDADELCRLAGASDVVAAFDQLAARPEGSPPSMRRPLQRVALAYLAFIRRASGVADSVAHFHLSNGALLERVDVDADPSSRGRESFGVMVNYVYEPQRLEANHERYVDGGGLAVSRALSGELRHVEAAWRRGQPA